MHRDAQRPFTTMSRSLSDCCGSKAGNGLQVLNDVWISDVGSSLDRMKWEQVVISGRKWPSARGYHTANLVQNVVIVGGGDGYESLSVMVLNHRASHHRSSPSRLNTKKRTPLRSLDRNQTLHATTPALMRLPATGRLSAIATFLSHHAILIHVM